MSAASPLPPEIRLVDDRDELFAFFNDLPAAHIYAHADLEPPWWDHGRWYRRGDGVAGVIDLIDHDTAIVYAVATRDPNATIELVRDLAEGLPPGTEITGPVGTADAISPIRAIRWHRPYLRYRLADPALVPTDDRRITALDASDLDELIEFYRSSDGAAYFLPHMVEMESFVGARDRGELIAAAGTHVIAERARSAAIGSVYVRPDQRGSGLGRAVTAGVVHRLGGRVDTIGLNVAVDNHAARSIYASIGFEPIHTYEEAILI